MERLKEQRLKTNQISSSSPAPSICSFNNNHTRFTSSSTGNFTTKSSDIYIYGVTKVPVLGTIACAFFAYNNKSLQTTNKEQMREQPIIYQSNLVCFR